MDRYITWPGQALSYKAGQLQLTQFRANAEQELGDLFDIKEFHDVILESEGPMTLVGKEVDEWVQSVLNPWETNMLAYYDLYSILYLGYYLKCVFRVDILKSIWLKLV